MADYEKIRRLKQDVEFLRKWAHESLPLTVFGIMGEIDDSSSRLIKYLNKQVELDEKESK